MERDCGDFKCKPDDHKHNTERVQGTELTRCGDTLAEINQQRAVRSTEEKRHAIQHDCAGEYTKQEILHTGFVALDIALAPCSEHVCRN